jgi:hypothetical protein
MLIKCASVGHKNFENVKYLNRRKQIYCDHAALNYVRLRCVGFAVQKQRNSMCQILF